MAILLFTPWYDIHQAVNIGRYNIVPFDTSTTNAHLSGNIDTDAKIILSSYLNQAYTPSQTRENRVKKLSLILWTNGDYDGDEIEVLQYVVSFAGICDRLFLGGDRYLCSDNFKIVVQNYPTPITTPFDPSITTSKKYGTMTIGFSADIFREVKPRYIEHQSIPGNTNFRLIFNEEVAQCLWQFYLSTDGKQSVWMENIFPSLFSFHQANTDGNSQQTDCIYSEAAFEKLFLGNGHGEQNLVNNVLAFIQSKNVNFEAVTSTTRNWQSITYRPQRNQPAVSCNSIFEAWLRELVRLRNKYAHGGHTHQGSLVWSQWEHLLLSAFIFPLLLKLYISQFDGSITYTISNDDIKRVRIIEQMLAESNYAQETRPHSGTTRWGKILSDAYWLT